MNIDETRLQVLEEFQRQIDVTFNDIELLNLALTHSSYSREFDPRLPDNEKLEFLGDAVLELASSTYLYKNFKNYSEGELTKTRASIVCQASLSKLAKKINIGNLLLLSSGEDSNGGRERKSTLEDAFEAVIGAIYLDQGWDVALDYVTRQLMPEFERARNNKGINTNDYKSALQEVIQSEPDHIIKYFEINDTGPDHMKEFECGVEIDGKVYGKGKGSSKKQAEQMAAKIALNYIKDIIPTCR